MSLVEQVFKVLLVHYGGARMAAFWQGLNPDEVKAYWAYQLAGCEPHMITYALEHLPDFPPSVSEFRAVARRAPQPQLPLLEHKRTPEDNARNWARIEELKQRFGLMSREKLKEKELADGENDEYRS